MLYSSHDIAILTVERAISDMKRGIPVLLCDAEKSSYNLVLATETILSKEFEWFKHVAPENARLILSRSRAAYLFPDKHFTSAISISAANYSLEALQQIGSSYPYPPLSVAGDDIKEVNSTQHTGLLLAKIAELLPSVLTTTIPKTSEPATWAGLHYLFSVQVEDIIHYYESVARTLEPISSTPLHLNGVPSASIIAFRARVGDREHYALVIGTPDPLQAPLVRIHSSCYTGDLLASLRCDCRDQLHLAMRQMSKAEEGGIVIYLMQEGRGIGLANKLRTYALQEEGIDTVDANEILGFEDDERLFLPAATMLKKLGYRTIQLLTNNPRKISAIEAYDIKVAKTVPLITSPGEHNQHYLHTKATRLGHTLPRATEGGIS